MDEHSWLWLSLSLPLLGIALERLLPGRGFGQVMLLIRWFGEQLANKVNRSTNGPKQQRLAGAIALLTVLTPLALGIALFNQLNPLSALLDALLLLCLLQWQAPMHSFHRITLLLNKQLHQQARGILRPWVLRDCDGLSAVGVAKASAEMLLLRLAANWFGVIFWFMLGGIVPALIYRIISELHLAWNPKLSQYRQFGNSASRFYQALSWLPFQLLALIICVYGKLSRNKAALSQGFRWPYSASGKLISVSASSLQSELGGPRHYQQQKVEQARFGPAKQYPEAAELDRLALKLNMSALLFLLILSPIYLVRVIYL
ncbi:cobalamin biosynthesis protein [Agarivorans sp. 1_MG-2023]|uniref:cobalamin biosynthesis protein CobD/CbiB n=1 Tax=Agarivorans sp. 1_MG-2023 TaxID=3062634 RepID=UPI0026E1C616|nr:cobalamin biosynthesis protein [Agarivorans sp. 1_MG-2023]MDO6763636.1 cobalamin biosynthesis protein [Agarivorans sp. 1_MG-2023]